MDIESIKKAIVVNVYHIPESEKVLEDIVGLTVFLASRASDYITGQTIFLDGGRTIL